MTEEESKMHVTAATLKWTSFTIACLVTMCSSFPNAFNAYGNDFKQYFNLTQVQVEVTLSAGALCASMGLPAGFVLEYLGLTISMMISLVLCSSGYLLMYSACFSSGFYHSHAALLVTYYGMSCLGTILMNLGSLLVAIRNFSESHRATVIGFIGGCWWGGPAIFSALYRWGFASEQNLAGYFLTTALIVATVNILAMIFLKEIPILNIQPSEKTALVLNDGDKLSIQDSNNKTDVTGLELLKSIDFHLIFWAYVMTVGFQMTLILNIGIFLKSFNHEELITPLTICGPITAAICKIISGFSSDKLLHKCPRSAFLCLLALLQVILLTLLTFNGQNSVIFSIVSIIIYVCNGVYYVLVPTLVSELFGVTYFPRNFGAMILFHALAIILLLSIFGTFYDDQITQEGSTAAGGLHCFRAFLYISVVIGVISSVLLFGLCYRQKIRM